MNQKSLFTAALIAAGIISQASAVNVVYLTGSTAFRSTVYNTLHSAAGPAAGGVFDIPGTTVGGQVAPAITEAEFQGSSASGANFMLFHGNIGGAETYIDCAWSGSNAGIASVANVSVSNDGVPLFGAPETWLKADGSITMNGPGTVGGTPTGTQLESSSRQGDIAMADTSQDSSLPPTQFVPNTSTALVDYGVVGVAAFTWLKNNNSASGASAAKTAWNNLVNVSTFQIQSLLGSGAVTADFLTGSSPDTNTMVYLVGRNKGSGTRANMMDDTTYGVNTPLSQYSIGGNLTGTPDGTLTLAKCTPTPNNGYESGGAVTTALGVAGSTSQADPFVNPFTTTHGAGWIAIGYASAGDAQKNGVTTANWLTENGVMSSDGAIETGTYSFWGHEHMFGRSNITGSFADTVANVMLTSLHFQLSTIGGTPTAHDSAIGFGFMNCDKLTDFSFPTHN